MPMRHQRSSLLQPSYDAYDWCSVTHDGSNEDEDDDSHELATPPSTQTNPQARSQAWAHSPHVAHRSKAHVKTPEEIILSQVPGPRPVCGSSAALHGDGPGVGVPGPGE